MTEDPKTMLNNANTQLRQCERLMFSGKYDELIAGIKDIQGILDTVKQTEPANPQIKTIEMKIEKIVKDVERRTGKNLGGGTGTTNATGSAPKLPDKPEVKPVSPSAPSSSASSAPKEIKLPYNARKPFQDAERKANSMHNDIEMFKSADRDDIRELYLKRLGQGITESRENLKQAREIAANEGLTDYPGFTEVEEKINSAEKEYLKLKEQYSQAGAAAAEAAGEVQTDCDAIREEYNRLQDTFNKVGNTYFNDLEPVKKILGIIEHFEQNEAPGVRAKIDAFAAKYGQTEEEIVRKTDSLGYTNNYGYNGAYGWKSLKEGLEKVAQARQALAGELLNKLNAQVANWPSMHDFARRENHNTTREFMEMAKKLAPDNTNVTNASAELEQKIADDLKALFQKIDQKEWPGNSSGKEAKEAMKWFEESEDWGKRPAGKETRTPLGVAIHGEWSVQARDITGTPTMYGLPVFIAVQVDTEKSENLTRVYDVTMRNLESGNAKPEPPFHSITVGNSWYIRPNKIK
ncbi:MAG: hypothetical protein JW737_02050 [Acidobacteria bacterium]|nr:hypothetical protein [Acidobacteriota bacterium]